MPALTGIGYPPAGYQCGVPVIRANEAVEHFVVAAVSGFTSFIDLAVP